MLKVDKALTKVLINHPFYATLLLSLEIRPDDQCDTLWTDGISLGYNPKFVEAIAPGDPSRCNLDVLEAALIHEAQHLALLHQFRLNSRDQNYWNQACDHLVNLELQDYGLSIPKDWLLDQKFRGCSEDQIYNQLVDQDPSPGSNQAQQSKTQSLQNSPTLTSGEIRPHPHPTQQAQQEWIQTVQRAIIAGRASEQMVRSFQKIIDPPIPLVEVMLRFFDAKRRGGYNYKRPNRRYPHFFLPQRKTKDLSKVLIAIDTSGSIQAETLSRFNQDLQETMRLLYLDELDIAYCDTEIHLDTLTQASSLKPVGGGGTDYRPVFKHAESEDYAGVIYLTDGHCDRFGNDYFPTLWVIYGNNTSFNPPFGEVFNWQ